MFDGIWDRLDKEPLRGPLLAVMVGMGGVA